MSQVSIPGAGRAAEMRRAFDAAFAAPIEERKEEVEDLLAIRVHGDPYGLSVREITGVAPAGRLVPLPSQTSALLGITANRGAIVPVFSLATLLGYEQGRESPRWLVLCGGREILGLALGEFEGYWRVSQADLHLPSREGRQHIHRFVRAGGSVRAIINVASIVAAIRGVKAAASTAGER